VTATLRQYAALSRQGLRSIDLKAGETIKAMVWAARDGKKLATVVRATTGKGKAFGLMREAASGGGPPSAFRPPTGSQPPSTESK
jgi:hypothetical protein